MKHGDVLGPTPKRYVGVVEPIVRELPGYTYEFMGEEFAHLCISDQTAAARVYWREILFRSHIAASTSLLRLFRWWSLIDRSIDLGDYFGFSAGLRAFFEAAADTVHGLQSLPRALAMNAAYIRQAVQGQADEFNQASELEEQLLHYSHASKRFATLGPKQKALTATRYFDSLAGDEHENLRACYAELCEVVHPAMDSVIVFIKPLDDRGSILELTTGDDANHIGHVTETYVTGIGHAWELGFNSPLLTLKVLNRIGMREVLVPYLESLDMSSWPPWQRLEPLLQ